MKRLIKNIMTFILATILFILILLMITILSCKNLISKENLSDYIKSVDILNMDLGIIFNLDEKGITLKEHIYNLAIENNVPEEIIIDILRSKEINDILGDFFKSTIDYTLKGDIKPSISKDAINKMNKLAQISLEDNINIMISEDELESYINDYALKLTNIVPDRTLIIGNYTVDNINNVLYFNMNYIYISIIIVAILLIIINKSFYKLFKYTGFSLFLCGLIFVIIGCMNNIIIDFLVNKYSSLKNFIDPLITNVSTIIFKNGVLASFSGVFIWLLYIMINRIRINSRKIR